MAGAEVHDNNSATNRAASAGTLGAAMRGACDQLTDSNFKQPNTLGSSLRAPAKRSIRTTKKEWIASLALAMTALHTSAFSRRLCARVVRQSFALKEGAGNAGRPMRPQPRVQSKKHTSVVTTVTPESPGIPRAMVLTVSCALSSVTGLSCHRHQQNEILRT
jgi:hypothetical protein